MASSIPEQTRTVDPYASYNSNVVNQLTGIVTRGSNGLDIDNALQVIPDSTSVLDHVVVLPGIIYKDDMLIEITSQFRVDFTDPSHYVSPPANPFTSETGIYYVCLEYTYVKSRPAPQAHIKILLPSQTGTYQIGGFPSLFFLKAVEVLVIGQIANLYDYDPDETTVKREYIRNYATTEVFLPTFNVARDQSRLVYVSQEDQYYFGYSTGWGAIGAVGTGGISFSADTSSFEIGDLVYVNGSGLLSKAIGPNEISSADGVVTIVGNPGIIQTAGKIPVMKIESSVTVAVGDLLYLSNSDTGTATNVRTSQFVGRCTSIIDSTSVEALFVRGESKSSGSAVSRYGVLDGTSWVSAGLFVTQDIDVSAFGGLVIPTLWNTSSYMIQPANYEYVSSSVFRIYMPSGFSENLNYLLVGPAL